MGVTINDLMGWEGPLTHRQMSTWVLFSQEILNRPSLTDQYIMSLTATVARILSKNPQNIKAEHFRLIFNGKEIKLTEKERKEELEYRKAALIARFGGMGNLTIYDHKGNLIKKPEPSKRNKRPQQQSQVATQQPIEAQLSISSPEEIKPIRRVKGRGRR